MEIKKRRGEKSGERQEREQGEERKGEEKALVSGEKNAKGYLCLC